MKIHRRIHQGTGHRFSKFNMSTNFVYKNNSYINLEQPLYKLYLIKRKDCKNIWHPIFICQGYPVPCPVNPSSVILPNAQGASQSLQLHVIISTLLRGRFMHFDIMDGYVDHGQTNPSSDQSVSPARRPRKRRKLSTDSQNLDEVHSSNEENSASSGYGSDIVENDEIDENAVEQPKPKSKYKIHIPKNPQLPTDAFFTQPPQRSSSPYRIDQFHWRKPTKQSTPPNVPFATPRQKSCEALRTNHKSYPLDHSNRENEPPGYNEVSQELADEFPLDESYTDMLADLPSDAFSSPIDPATEKRSEPILISSQQAIPSQYLQSNRLAAPLANLRQTTLFGTQAAEVNSQTQSNRKRNWPLANREEPPTHHKLDQEAMKTWVYPINLGTIRDYQYSIVARGLYHNMLVALPTGLGKTFIAATIMLNWFRWTTEAQIVFVAPTKPLVSQQVKACFDVAGIPRSKTTMLTGGIPPGLRAEEWLTKRVFFMTPQTIVNDLKTGICDPKKLVLLVVDEAHRATGGYAYVEVVKFLRRFNSSFRVLALTATPGSSVESVQEVIDGLGISRVEIRTEESLDIRQYVHSRKIETILFDNSDEMAMVMDLFSRALQPVLDRLNGMNAYWLRDPMTLTPYGCNQARQRWMASDAGRTASFGIKGMVNTIFSLLASLAHGIELLKFHGIGPFYHKILSFRNEIHAQGKKGGKYANEINESEPFQTMMSRVQLWINNPDFMSHPKLEYLQSVVMNHFLDAGEGRDASDPSSTKVMVFAHYRDSAEEIARVLRRNDPMVRPHVFVGQANSKGSEGMDQKKQLDIIKKFQSGIYNTLVATSIGEEGLDIGEVDLIICYDASASPIRMLQRMGRTGRKRAGNIVVTLMKGKEENNFIKAKDNYEKMQSEIALGTRFNFHDEESRRIVPRDIQPVVDKRIIEIPPENTQPELPEPTKRGRPPKRPPKRFHMPDGVQTGFMKASRLGNKDSGSKAQRIQSVRKPRTPKDDSPNPLPPWENVLLTAAEEKIFERKYLDIQGSSSQIVEVPRNDAFPILQRTLRPTICITHSTTTTGFVNMLERMRRAVDNNGIGYEESLAGHDKEAGTAQAERRAAFFLKSYSPATAVDIPFNDSSLDHDSLPSEADLALPQHRNTIEISSAEDEDWEDDLGDLINNDIGAQAGNVSSKYEPPPVGEAITGPSSKIMDDFADAELDSEGELPDFRTLVRKGNATKATVPSQGSSKTSNLAECRRRGGRKVLEEDSDDE